MESQDADVPRAWRFLGQWPTIAMVSIVLLILTLNPLLTGLLPYLRAGWPALRTAFWLKQTDPWTARGTVGFLFHLGMALFRAGACGFVCVLSTVVIANVTQKQPDLRPFIVAILTIAFGCILSSIFGWIGIAIALRHRVRIFVMSNLYSVCHGDFTVATTLGPGITRTNPANYIIGVAAAAPLLAIWFAAMLTTAPGDHVDKIETAPFILLVLLPFLIIACIALVVFLSGRITAQSPGECWGAAMPESEAAVPNWYQSTE